MDGEFENGLFIITTEELGTIRSVLTINSALANHTGEYFCNATSTVSFYESVMSKVSLVLVQGEYVLCTQNTSMKYMYVCFSL